MASSLRLFLCLLNSSCPWEIISAIIWSIASQGNSGTGGGSRGLRSVLGFDCLPLVTLAACNHRQKVSSTRHSQNNSSRDVIIGYEYAYWEGAVSLCDILALSFDLVLENT